MHTPVENLASPGKAACRKHTHPSKAGLHAAAFASAPHLSTSSHLHDSATSIIRSALRSIVASCAASPSARLRCLHSLPQLDRLPPGSRVEAKRGRGVVPRGRGDVHPDLTALVFTFTLHPTLPHSATQLSSAQLRAVHIAVCPMCAFAARHFLTAPHACDEHPHSHSHSTCCSLQAVSAEHSTQSAQSPHAPEATPPQPQSPTSGPAKAPCKLKELSKRMWDSIPCPRVQHARHRRKSSTDSLLASTPASQILSSTPPSSHSARPASAVHSKHTPGSLVDDTSTDLSDSSCSSTQYNAVCCNVRAKQEAQRRWRLLQRHVWVGVLERGLRRSMWESACSAALNALAPTSIRGDDESFCSLPQSPTSPSRTVGAHTSVSGVPTVAAASADAGPAGFDSTPAFAVLTAH